MPQPGEYKGTSWNESAASSRAPEADADEGTDKDGTEADEPSSRPIIEQKLRKSVLGGAVLEAEVLEGALLLTTEVDGATGAENGTEAVTDDEGVVEGAVHEARAVAAAGEGCRGNWSATRGERADSEWAEVSTEVEDCDVFARGEPA